MRRFTVQTDGVKPLGNKVQNILFTTGDKEDVAAYR
jgi:hypothetical protein